MKLIFFSSICDKFYLIGHYPGVNIYLKIESFQTLMNKAKAGSNKSTIKIQGEKLNIALKKAKLQKHNIIMGEIYLLGLIKLKNRYERPVSLLYRICFSSAGLTAP